MILTPHMAAGVAIALLAPNPYIGIPLAFLSHYILDALPHAEYDTEKIKGALRNNFKDGVASLLRLGLDGGGGFVALLFAAVIFGHSPFIAASGAIAGILPDGLTVLLWLLPKNKILAKHFDFHRRIHFPKNKKPSQFLRVGLQFVVLLLAVLALALIRFF